MLTRKARTGEDAKEREARIKLEEFRRRLKDTSLLPFNPIKELRLLLCLSPFEMATAISYSYGRYCGIEQGLAVEVPSAIIDLAKLLLGPGAGVEFQAAWQRFLDGLSGKVKRNLEKRFFLCRTGTEPGVSR